MEVIQGQWCPTAFGAILPLPKSFPSLLLRMTLNAWNAEFEWANQVVTPSNSCPPITEGTGWDKENTLTMSKCCSSIAKTLLYYQHCFSHKPKPHPTPADTKNINSIPAGPRTTHTAIQSHHTAMEMNPEI